jgi:hypothetical protein
VGGQLTISRSVVVRLTGICEQGRSDPRGGGAVSIRLFQKADCAFVGALAFFEQVERLADAGIGPSVGRVGDSYDNALAETISELYKAEVIHRRGPWRSFEAVEFATLELVDWFNNHRLLEPIGNIPPAEAEARYYASLNQTAMAA